MRTKPKLEVHVKQLLYLLPRSGQHSQRSLVPVGKYDTRNPFRVPIYGRNIGTKTINFYRPEGTLTRTACGDHIAGKRPPFEESVQEEWDPKLSV